MLIKLQECLLSATGINVMYLTPREQQLLRKFYYVCSYSIFELDDLCWKTINEKLGFVEIPIREHVRFILNNMYESMVMSYHQYLDDVMSDPDIDQWMQKEMCNELNSN